VQAVEEMRRLQQLAADRSRQDRRVEGHRSTFCGTHHFGEGTMKLAILALMMIGGAGAVVSSAPIKVIAPTPTQNWDQNLQSNSRFTALSAFGGAAVMDGNTGLVWEQAPDTTTRTWSVATSYCANKTVGGGVGWRLPSVIELKSLQDPSLAEPLVPTSVFTGVQATVYWSATTVADQAAFAWVVFFTSSSNNTIPGDKANVSALTWCVRGPMQQSVY
jgi:hypothetical protein